MSVDVDSRRHAAPVRARSDIPFFACLGALSGMYLLLIAAMLFALGTFTTPSHLVRALRSPEILYAAKLSLVSCTLTTILSLWVAVPIGYLMSRYRFRGKNLADAVLDIPIVLPPLVIGLALLILFQMPLGTSWFGWPAWTLETFLNRRLGIAVTFAVPSVVIAQFVVACAFAVRTMRVTFDQINPRSEQVALTLGCSRGQAFWLVVLPDAGPGMLAAAAIAWARAMGEFGPILVFAGATRMRTEVLPTTVFLELSIGEIEAAVAVSLIMVFVAVCVLVVARMFGLRRTVV